MMRRVCLVTDELYPFTAGGIGRVLHNLALQELRQSADLEIHFLLPSSVDINADRVMAYFGPRIVVHYAEQREGWTPTAAHGAEYPPTNAFTDSDWHAQSLELFLALKRLAAREKSLEFDAIEFPDYRGWAYCTLQEKLLGAGFQRTEICVRIHSTDGALQEFEAREPSLRQAARFDLERKALHDADRVIAHLPAIARHNSALYGFEPEWDRKVVVAFPPVLSSMERRPVPNGVRDLLFITKLQAIKRPDVFIRGACAFLRAHLEFTGRAILACHAPDQVYLARLRAMIPADLSERFTFAPSGPERDAFILGSLVVIPSAYESLNLAAYEAAAAGARLMLNGRCLAFGDGTPWKDGVNCHKFDGTVDGLAAALARAVAAPAPDQVRWIADQSPWDPPPAAERTPSPIPAERPLVSIVIPNYNLGRWLPETLASVAASSYEELEVIVVDDASTDPFDATVLERLEEDREGPLRVLRNPVNRGLAASRNIGIAAARGKYIVPLDADDAIGPRFIAQAVAALEAHAEYDVVVPTAGYFDSDAQLADRVFADYACFIGDAPSVGLVANRMSCCTSLMRRSLFDQLRYDETLDSYEDWSLYLRAALAGKRFLVTNDVQFFYRRRPGSMISGINPERHLRLLERMYASLPRPLPASVQLFATLGPSLLKLRENEALLQEIKTARSALQPPPPPPPPMRHTLADMVNTTVKKVPLVHPLLRLTVEKLRSVTGAPPSADRPLRYDVADALNAAMKKVPILHPLLKASVSPLAKDQKP